MGDYRLSGQIRAECWAEDLTAEKQDTVVNRRDAIPQRNHVRDMRDCIIVKMYKGAKKPQTTENSACAVFRVCGYYIMGCYENAIFFT